MKVILCILDGFGIRPLDSSNALRIAKNWNHFLKIYPWIQLKASAEAVGLPAQQMGNSEVGHMTIGLGKIVYQDLPRLNDLFQAGDVWKTVPEGGNTCHIMGLLSPGGVHSHEDHFFQVVSYMAKRGTVWVHPFLDGRDTAPQSALASLENLMCIPGVRVGTLMGRFYAMDRDQRLERTSAAIEAIQNGIGKSFSDPLACLKEFYQKGITDEFVPPCVHQKYSGFIPNDSLWMINFRADRVRQLLTRLLTLPWSWTLGMSHYGLSMPSVLEPFSPHDSLGELVSQAGLKQMRIAETEKYAHVTFFFNGGREEPFSGEDRIMVPSPSVHTYDLQPEMSAQKVTDHVICTIEADAHDLIVVNYANADMVGHTGIVSAIETAILTLDRCLKRLEEKVLENDWALVITADHGNAEYMFNEDGSPHTAHTCSPVPLMLIARNPIDLVGEGLKDIKGIVLELLGR